MGNCISSAIMSSFSSFIGCMDREKSARCTPNLQPPPQLTMSHRRSWPTVAYRRGSKYLCSKYKSRRFFPLSHQGQTRLSSFPPHPSMPKERKQTRSRLSQPSRISDKDASFSSTVARSDDSAAASATSRPTQASQVEQIQNQLESKISHSRSHAKACDRCYRAKRRV